MAFSEDFLQKIVDVHWSANYVGVSVEVDAPPIVGCYAAADIVASFPGSPVAPLQLITSNGMIGPGFILTDPYTIVDRDLKQPSFDVGNSGDPTFSWNGPWLAATGIYKLGQFGSAPLQISVKVKLIPTGPGPNNPFATVAVWTAKKKILLNAPLKLAPTTFKPGYDYYPSYLALAGSDHTDTGQSGSGTVVFAVNPKTLAVKITSGRILGS